ncbi:MAG: hypothetical protein U1E45_05665 [Geminicoccaceae bacterium]
MNANQYFRIPLMAPLPDNQKRYDEVISAAPKDLLVEIPDNRINDVHNALIRYYFFSRVMDDDADLVRQGDQNRAAFPQFLGPKAENGTHGVVFENMVGFMSAACGLPRSWCAAFAYLDSVQYVALGWVDETDVSIAEEYRLALACGAGTASA